MEPQSISFRNITISGKIASGTSTLAKNLQKALGWQRINAGEIQRLYDREHGIDENARGALARSDKHEREIEAMTKAKLEAESNLIYEAWLSGFISRGIPGVLKVLLVCSEDAVRIDRVANREKISIDDAKRFIRSREEENIVKWKKLYGDHDFWDPKAFDVVVDTFSSGPMETLGKVLDRLSLKK